MARSIEHYQGWLAHDGKKVVVDGLAYTIHAKSYLARYPVVQEMITVYAEPQNKQSKRYRTVKANLGDEWSTDVLESDVDVFVKFLVAAEATVSQEQ